MKRNEDITYNFQDTPLQIKSDSALGSDQTVNVQFFNVGGEYAGGVEIQYGDTMKYKIKDCKSAQLDFGVTIPSATERTWMITKKNPLSIIIHCNNVEVAVVLISPDNCDEADWFKYWSRIAKKIKFTLGDTASDSYWGPVCTILNPNWNNMSNMRANKAFPVAEGTVVSLSCIPGFQLTGDGTVTCSVGTEYKYSAQPQCGEFFISVSHFWLGLSPCLMHNLRHKLILQSTVSQNSIANCK